jgi:hypothetical protein
VAGAAGALLEQALSRALAGPLVEAVSRDLVRYEVLDRVAETLLRGNTLESILERMEDADVPRRLVESRFLDEVVRRVLESEELWLLVEEIARSPAVTEAIGQQSVGFADQVADGVRARSRRADAWLERAARRALRRTAADELPDESAAPRPSTP